MKSEKDKFSYIRKDVYISYLSIVLLALMLVVQVVSLYDSYKLRADLLQKELNEITVEVYKRDLASRLKKATTEENRKYLFNGLINPVDSKDIEKHLEYAQHRTLIVPSFNGVIENYLSETSFMNLDKVDSIADVVFARNEIKLAFYTEIVDTHTGEVIGTTKPPSRNFVNRAESKGVVLDEAGGRIFRIVLVNPLNLFFLKAIVIVFTLLTFLIIIITNIYYQNKTIAKQRDLVTFKNDLFAEISHEMKKPLSVMSLVVSSFEKEAILVDEIKRARYIKMAKSEIDKMVNQTEMALTLAKDDEGTFEVNLKEFNIVEMVSELADKYIYISEKEVDIEIIDALDKSTLQADPEHIEYVIANLITNSIKYSSEFVHIIIKLYEENEDICISVKDNGVGMTEEEQKHIFDRYYRTRKVSGVEGHGIGLSYVDRIMKKYGGKVQLYSDLGKGSEFIVKLPQYYDVMQL